MAGETVDNVTEEEQQMAIVGLMTTGKQHGRPRQTDKAKVPAERVSLIPDASDETGTEAQVGTVTEAQNEPQSTTAQRKTTKQQGRLGEVDTIDESAGEASLVSGKADNSSGEAVTDDDKQQAPARQKTARKRSGRANKVDKAP